MMNIDPFNPDKDFVRWIMSINKDWRNQINYEPFNEYRNQAKEWLSEERDLTKITDPQERLEYKRQEKKRISENSIYYISKYLYIKEGNTEGGRIKAQSFPSQDVMCYLFDNMYNIMIGKARGVGGTSAFLPICMKRSICRQNYFSKFVCSSEDKVKILFEHKLKFAYYNHPTWMQPPVGSNRKDGFEFFSQTSKESKEGVNSLVVVSPPRIDSINGENPDLVIIDEAPSIKIYSQMTQEGIPALFRYDFESKKRVMVRQFVAWGTSLADEDNEISLDYETDFRALLDAWDKEDYSMGIVPLFLNKWSIPGYDDIVDMQNRKMYYLNKTGDSKEHGIISFRKHFPEQIDDLFLRNSETIIPYEQIDGRLKDIFKLEGEGKIALQKGYFTPVYGRVKMPDTWVSPYNIVDVIWNPVEDDSPMAAITIFMHPEKGWKYRYFQGTDPITSPGGHSMFSSSIWDSYYNTIPAILNYRPHNFKLAYEQTLCMNIYYNNACELIENNIGQDYISYREAMGGTNMLVRMELPKDLQVGAHEVGIAKKSTNKDKIALKTLEMLNNYKDRIYQYELFNQLKTYVEKKNQSQSGSSFAPNNPKYDFDDVIDSTTYSYIASVCYDHLKPMEEDKTTTRLVPKKICDESTGWRIQIVMVPEKRIVEVE